MVDSFAIARRPLRPSRLLKCLRARTQRPESYCLKQSQAQGSRNAPGAARLGRHTAHDGVLEARRGAKQALFDFKMIVLRRILARQGQRLALTALSPTAVDCASST